MNIETLLDLYASGHVSQTLSILQTAEIQPRDRELCEVLKTCCEIYQNPSSAEYEKWLDSENPGLLALAKIGLSEQKEEVGSLISQDEIDRLDTLTKSLVADAIKGSGDLGKALDLCDEDTAVGRLTKVSLLLYANQVDEASELAMSQVTQYPCSPSSHIALGLVLIYQQKFSEAISAFEASNRFAISLHEENCAISESSTCGIAASLMLEGNWEQARNTLTVVQKFKPNMPNILANLITCCTNLGDLEQAKIYLKKLREVQPKHPLITNYDQIKECCNS